MTASTRTRKPLARKAPVEPQRISTIPDKDEYLRGYRIRKHGGINEFVLLDFAMNSHSNVLLKGPTGSGKTSGVYAWAAYRNLHCYSISSNIGVEASQLFGRHVPMPTDENPMNIAWQDGPVTDIVRYGGVLLINEVNFLPARVATVLFSLLDKRREIQLVDHHGEVIKAHEDCLVVADMNPEYAGTQEMNKAFLNRFSMQFNVDYSHEVERRLVKCGTLLDLAKKFRQQATQDDWSTPVSTNMLTEFERNYQHLGWDVARLLFLAHFTAEDHDPAGKLLDTVQDEVKRELVAKIPRLTPYGDPLIDKKLGGEWNVKWSYEDDEMYAATQLLDDNGDPIPETLADPENEE